VLKTGLVMQRMLDHGCLWRRVRFVLFGRVLVSLLVVVTSGTAFALEVGRTLVFVCAAILSSS